MKKAVMNYSNYDMHIVQKFQVKLIGWTFNKFISPFEINTIDDVRTLVGALRCGRCHWVQLTAAEISKHAKDVEARKVAGETVGNPRKVRSDVGTKRPHKGTVDDYDDGDNEPGPSKKRKVAVPKSMLSKKPSTASKTDKGEKKAHTKKNFKWQLPPGNQQGDQ